MLARIATKSALRCISAVRLLLQANRLTLAILLIGLTAMASGCSGINASRSFSPLDFLLPGLLHIENSPQGLPLQHATNSVVVVAKAR